MIETRSSNIHCLQPAFPEFLPVTGCDFLAYSCAAARELHPLPCLRHKAKTRKPKDISKNEKYWFEKFTGGRCWKSTGGHGLVAEPVWDANKPPKCQPILAS
jgi:hypothetical protein